MNHEPVQLRPTGLWVLFGPIFGCMWLAAVNYSNNLVYAILYLISSLTFISLFYTWRNLSGLEVEFLRIHPAFAGGEVRVEIHFRNSGRHPIYGITLTRLDEQRKAPRFVPLPLPGGGEVRVKGGDTQATDFFFPAGRRGRYQLGSLMIRSSYPFGLIYARFLLPVSFEYFVYPEARGDKTLPMLRPRESSKFAVLAGSGDDFAGVRAYAPGESLRHVDWKAYARGRGLSVKQFGGEDSHELWLQGENLLHLQPEDRLSQLALWVVEAEKADLPYLLRLGNASLPSGQGPDHAREALEILAMSGLRRQG